MSQMAAKSIEDRRPLAAQAVNEIAAPPTKRRRLSVSSSVIGSVSGSQEAPIDLDAEEEVPPKANEASETPKNDLFFPSPSPDEAPRARPRRLDLKQRPLPPCPLPSTSQIVAEPYQGRWHAHDEDDEDELADGYEQTMKERVWHAMPAWWGNGEIFPRGGRSSSPLSSPGPLELNFSHDAPHARRWACVAPELDLHSYNPTRPPTGKLFTPRQAHRWMVKEERCLDIGNEPPHPTLKVWTAEELKEKRAMPYRHAWHETKPKYKRLEECLPALP